MCVQGSLVCEPCRRLLKAATVKLFAKRYTVLLLWLPTVCMSDTELSANSLSRGSGTCNANLKQRMLTFSVKVVPFELCWLQL